jgi:hypothetical protein
LFYGQYDKPNPIMIALLRRLTNGQFENGAIARVLAREFWTRGEAPTFREYASAWIDASDKHLEPNPEWAFLSDRTSKGAVPNWKNLRNVKAAEVLKVLDQITTVQIAVACTLCFMQRFNNANAPDPNPGWFDWLPQKVQCFLILLFTLPITAVLFMAGMHCVHTGKPIVLGPSSILDAGELFFSSLIGLVVSGGIFAVMMGWAKSARPHVSETHHPRPRQ